MATNLKLHNWNIDESTLFLYFYEEEEPFISYKTVFDL